MVKGYLFQITDMLFDENNYWITLEYPGTAHAPMTLRLEREPIVVKSMGVSGYALHKDTSTTYITPNTLRSLDEFVAAIQRYLNNL